MDPLRTLACCLAAMLLAAPAGADSVPAALDPGPSATEGNEVDLDAALDHWERQCATGKAADRADLLVVRWKGEVWRRHRAEIETRARAGTLSAQEHQEMVAKLATMPSQSEVEAYRKHLLRLNLRRFCRCLRAGATEQLGVQYAAAHLGAVLDYEETPAWLAAGKKLPGIEVDCVDQQ